MSPARWVFRHGFVPLLVAACVGSLVYRPELAAWLSSRGVRTDATTAVVLALIVLVSLAEQVFPANPEWNYRLLSRMEGWSQLGRDLAYLFLVAQVSARLATWGGAKVEAGLGGWSLRGLWPGAAPFGVKVALAFFAIELASWATHWAAHHVGLLWRFHATHHVITSLTGLKALRTHPVDNLAFAVARAVPLVLLGAGPEEAAAAASLGGMLGILAHANLDVAPGPLGLLVNYPRYHAVHHSADLSECLSNYGCHTVLFDRLFGTFRAGAKAPLVVGVEPVATRSAWQELVGPFYRAKP
jgi:sterol desaturase/sphingolipid hydroxylase (fatty acid hydroxylase superfamily)